jgi:hypothetical protein
MRDTFRLPATAQHQVWLEGKLVDVGSPVAFDAHDAMIGLHTEQFGRIAGEISSGGKNCRELALASPETQKWWFSSIDNAYAVTVNPFDFEDWLDSVGLTMEEAVNIDDGALAGLLAGVSRDAPAGRGTSV